MSCESPGREVRGQHRRLLPLEQAADAHAAIESRATTGKVILLP
ncbi:zinc-binding dehydrogenase [Arthrobacter sp. AFG20]